MLKRLPTWREMHMDTTPEIEAVQFALLRQATPANKLKMLESLSQTAWFLTYQHIQERHPDASNEMIRYLFLKHMHGEEIASVMREIILTTNE